MAAPSAHSEILILGIGNTGRGDDGAGPEAVGLLARRLRGPVRVKTESGEVAHLLDAWSAFQNVIVIDAVVSGSAPGTVHRFETADRSLPATFTTLSSHAMSLAEAIELARMLGRLPRRLVVYGIEGERFEHGEPLSAAVAAALEELVHQVVDEACSQNMHISVEGAIEPCMNPRS